jgi:hypothetical protein
MLLTPYPFRLAAGRRSQYETRSFFLTLNVWDITK